MAESDLIRGNVDTIILKVLYEGDRYGYDLIRQINARSEGQWEIKQPTVYACLKRLEKQGFVSSYWDSAESDGGRRKYYSLTESGRAVFLKYKSEFDRATELFGDLMSSGEPTVFLQPTDDYSDVEEEDYPLPKRKPNRSKKADKSAASQQTEQPTEQQTEQQSEQPVEQPIQAEQPTQPEQEPPQSLFELTDTPEEPQPIPESLDPKKIMEQLFAAETGESYSDIQRKNTFSPMEPVREKEKPVEKKTLPMPSDEQRPVAPVPTQPTQPAPMQPTPPPAPVQSAAPIATDERPMLVPRAIPGMEPTPEPGLKPLLETEEESPARREYKSVLEELVERFDVSAPDVRTVRTAEREQAATAEAAAPGQLGKVEQAVRELGNDVKVRNHNNSAKEYAGKNYYYSNKLMLVHYLGMCLAMFLVGTLLFLTFYLGLNMRMKYDYVLYICAGLLPIFMSLAAVICYANNPEKTRRINFNFKFSIIIRIVIMIQVAVVIYCVNLIWGMPLAFSEYYIPSIVLPLAYSLFIPISEIIFMKLLQSGKYSESV
ncbi:MAG: helix-turn-helix transcriptional regulator [Clostridiales bacterium]|nr:helix-turn-helix transcriptional regulator [Clostridiales bacterium]